MVSSSSVAPGAPQHPVPDMRSAFEESVLESSGRQLQRPKHHRLQKIVAQLAFGLYLLHDGLAKSDTAVIRILQGHINDMDFFLSATTTDFAYTSADVSARLHHLQIPLREPVAFDAMLESRTFRREMAARNEAIDTVVQRTTAALQVALRDVRRCLVAVDTLAKYLLDLRDGWKKLGLVRVYAAMTHNVVLWARCCAGLQMKGMRIAEKLNLLQEAVQEMERRTGAASRKHKSAVMVFGPNNEPRPPSPSCGVDKPLPETPKPKPAIQNYLPPRRPRSAATATILASDPPLPSQQLPSRTLSQKLRKGFRHRSKSMDELAGDKGKQREEEEKEEEEEVRPPGPNDGWRKRASTAPARVSFLKRIGTAFARKDKGES